MSVYQFLDLSQARRIFTVGDIHGCFGLLVERLSELGFDYTSDYVISVGDLVDRGPMSNEAINFAVQPWFRHIRGNHEELVKMAVLGMNWAHVDNGGEWFTTLPPQEREANAQILFDDAPTILEVLTPSGRRIGFVHAAYPFDEWSDHEAAAEVVNKNGEIYCLWDRTQIKKPYPNGIRGIDHVYYGHTPVKEPKTVANVSWIDTKAYKSNILTVLEIQ